jgi:hypothetical protein
MQSLLIASGGGGGCSVTAQTQQLSPARVPVQSPRPPSLVLPCCRQLVQFLASLPCLTELNLAGVPMALDDLLDLPKQLPGLRRLLMDADVHKAARFSAYLTAHGFPLLEAVPVPPAMQRRWPPQSFQTPQRRAFLPCLATTPQARRQTAVWRKRRKRRPTPTTMQAAVQTAMKTTGHPAFELNPHDTRLG